MSLKSTLEKFPSASSDWSNLHAWLKSVETLIRKDPSSVESEKYLLATRLAQCFNTEAVTQVHVATLEIYSLLFQSQNMIRDFSLFSAGLLHYFELATFECRLQILTIIDNFILPQCSLLTFAYPGIVGSLLPGLSDRSEIADRIVHIFDSIASKDRPSLFGAVWQAILRSLKLRQPGLKYLLDKLPKNSSELRLFLPQKNLLINSLVASMSSLAGEVQNLTLTLLIRLFPIFSPVEVLDDKEKVTLMQQGFKMLRSENKNLAFEWLFPYEMVDHWTELKQKALRGLFVTEGKKQDDSVLPLDIILILLDRLKGNLVFFQPILVPMLKYSLRNNETQSYKKIEERILELLKYENVKNEIWTALKVALDEDLRSDRSSSVEVIQFFIAGFEAGYDQNSIISILESLLTGIHQLHESLTKVLELIQMIMNRVKGKVPELSEAIKKYHNFFSTISNDPNRSNHLKIVASLLLSLEKHASGNNEDDWVKCLFEAMLNNDKELALIGIENIIDLLDQENQAYYRDLLDNYCEESDIISELFDKLWDLIEEQGSRKKVIELFLKLDKFNHQHFIEKLKNKLIKPYSSGRMPEARLSRNSLDKNQEVMVKDIKKGLKIFTEFWKFTCKFFPAEIAEKFSNGDGVFLVIDYLEDPSPEIRQLAREWIFESLEKFEYVLNPIIKILLEVQVVEKGEFYELVGHCENQLILYAFKKLKKLIRNGGETIIAKTKNLKCVNLEIRSFLEKNKCMEVTNYLESMVEISLLYIKTDTPNLSLQKETHTIRAASAEFLDMALSLADISLAHRIMMRVLQVLSQSIEKKDGVLQLLLLNILRVIFFEFNPSPNDELFKSIISSSLFSSVYLEVLKIEDSYIFSHWISFIVESLPRVMQFLAVQNRLDYYQKLIFSFCEGIPKTPDKQPLLNGLKAVLHRALEIGEDRDYIDPPIPMNAEKKSAWRIFGSSRIQENQEINIKFEIMNKLESVIKTCLLCINNFNLPVEVSKDGTGVFKTGNLNRANLPVLEILNPIMVKYPNETVCAVINLWKTKLSDEDTKKIVFIMICLHSDLKVVLSSIVGYLDKIPTGKKQVLDSVAEISGICHLVYSVFACSTEDAIPKRPEDCLTFWQVCYSFLAKVEINSPWLLDILALMLTRVKIDDALKDVSLKKNFQVLTENLVKNVNLITFQQNQVPIYPPFPPSVYIYPNKDRLTQSLGSLLVLKSTLFKIINSLFQADSREKGLSLIQSPVMEALNLFSSNSSTFDVEQTAELMSSLLCLPDTKPSEKFKKQVIDYSIEQNFFKSMRNSVSCLAHWKKILNAIATHHYPDKNLLVKEILNRELGIFASEQQKRLHKTCKLKSLAFFIYSSDRDVYQNTVDTIIKSLTEILKSEKTLNPWVFFTVRVLLLKLSHNALNNNWPQLWPHLLTELMQMLQPEEPLMQKFAALKFLDLFSALNSEEFLIYQWLFFYDSMNSELFNNCGQFPLVNRLINEESSIFEIEKTTTAVERLLVMKIMPATDEELNRLTKELCRQVVMTNTLRSIIREDNIESVVEEDFFMLNFQ